MFLQTKASSDVGARDARGGICDGRESPSPAVLEGIAGSEALPAWHGQKCGDRAATKGFEGKAGGVGWKETPAVALGGLEEMFSQP